MKIKPRDIFLASLERCEATGDFIPAFYRRFLSSSPEVARKFVGTNFEDQERMLIRSLRLCAGATTGDSSALKELRERAETHDRFHMNIPPEMYELWQGALMATVRQLDPQWSEDCESAFALILDHVVQHMVKYY